MLIPNSEQVIQAWIKSNGWTATASTLPEDNSSWAASGFIQTTVVGGAPAMYTRISRPMVQIDCWATNSASSKVPWQKANQLAETVKAWTWNLGNQGVDLALAGNYQPARLLSAYVVSEPRAVHDPNLSYARYTFDLLASWTY